MVEDEATELQRGLDAEILVNRSGGSRGWTDGFASLLQVALLLWKGLTPDNSSNKAWCLLRRKRDKLLGASPAIVAPDA